jgi:hypothetical protein
LIIFDLKCPFGHVFEAWFGSSADYDDQKSRGLIGCPICGAQDIEKAPMAPAVGAKGNSRVTAPSAGLPLDLSSADPKAVKAMLSAAAAVQKKLLENSESVGDRFADEARAIHLGDADARAIHGRATREQAVSLIEEGIAVAPLPFPIAEPGEEN